MRWCGWNFWEWWILENIVGVERWASSVYSPFMFDTSMYVCLRERLFVTVERERRERERGGREREIEKNIFGVLGVNILCMHVYVCVSVRKCKREVGVE